MIEVKIRDTGSAFGQSLGQFTPSEIDNLVECAQRYGYTDGSGNGDFIDARFVFDPNFHKMAHFEIVFDLKEDD